MIRSALREAYAQCQSVAQSNTCSQLVEQAGGPDTQDTPDTQIVGGEKHLDMLYQMALENAGKDMMCSDISATDYNKYKEDILEEVPVLRDVYCDDAVFVRLIHADSFTSFNETTEFQPSADYLTELINSFSFTATLKKVGSDVIFSSERSTRTKIDEPKEEINKILVDVIKVMTNRIRRRIFDSSLTHLIDHYDATRQEKGNDMTNEGIGYIAIKVSFSTWPLDSVIRFISTTKEDMLKKGFFLYQFDATIDLGCSFEKTDLEEYLEDIGHKKKSSGWYRNYQVGPNCILYSASPLVSNKLNDLIHHALMEQGPKGNTHSTHSTHLVGAKQVTDVKGLTDSEVRYKVYNKFSQSLESGVVTNPIGDNLFLWMLGKNKPSRESVDMSMQYGFTRIELSFYDGEDLTSNINEIQEFKKLIVMSGKLFKCPIENQFLSFCESLTSNALFIDSETNEYLLAQWCHRMTKRIGGTYGTLSTNNTSKEDFIKYVTSHYSILNTPFYVVQVSSSTSNKEKMKINIDLFLKNDNCEKTFVWKGRENGIHFIQNEEKELKNKHIHLSTLTPNLNVFASALRNDILSHIGLKTIFRTTSTPWWKLNKQSRIMSRIRSNIYYGKPRPLSYAEKGVKYEVRAMKEYGGKDAKKYTLIASDANKYLSIDELSNMIDQMILSDRLHKKQILLSGGIYCLDDLDYIFSFSMDESTHLFVNSFEVNPRIRIDPQNIKVDKLRIIDENIINADSHPIDELVRLASKFDEWKITHIKRYMYRNKIKYMIKIDDVKNLSPAKNLSPLGLTESSVISVIGVLDKYYSTSSSGLGLSLKHFFDENYEKIISLMKQFTIKKKDDAIVFDML
jgi:arsenate reductase-like glutaredoxin family protein